MPKALPIMPPAVRGGFWSEHAGLGLEKGAAKKWERERARGEENKGLRTEKTDALRYHQSTLQFPKDAGPAGGFDNLAGNDVDYESVSREVSIGTGSNEDGGKEA